ncbi:hypothetical protein [Streptomyces buecherae]|uniref:hypothetical protein n=1 Tax=Streptomyces buecherae TaxID=2763006 RepID=UPI0037A74CF0
MAAAQYADATTTEDTATRVIDGRFELLERLGSGKRGSSGERGITEQRRKAALNEVRPPDPRYAEDASRGAAVPRGRVRCARPGPGRGYGIRTW